MIVSRIGSRLIQNKNFSLAKQARNIGSFIQHAPPKNKLSTGELWVMGFVLLAGIFGPSFYVAANMQEYNGKNEARRKGATEA